MEQLKRWFSSPRGVAITAIVVVVIALLFFRGRSGETAQAAGPGAGKAGAAKGGPGAMPPMPVDVDTARVRPIIDAVRATGRIEAVQAVELRSDEQGRVTALMFHRSEEHTSE